MLNHFLTVLAIFALTILMVAFATIPVLAPTLVAFLALVALINLYDAIFVIIETLRGKA